MLPASGFTRSDYRQATAQDSQLKSNLLSSVTKTMLVINGILVVTPVMFKEIYNYKCINSTEVTMLKKKRNYTAHRPYKPKAPPNNV